jgi:dTDP-4-amino-4,6-dideoxygalactose transaminase
MVNPHKITEDFEAALCEYTGAPFAVAVDNQSNALFLCLWYEKNVLKTNVERIGIPFNTYPSVPCEIIHAGFEVEWYDYSPQQLKGGYWLGETTVVDSALRFTADMFQPTFKICLSFTGPHKHLKLGKGGAILHDDPIFDKWVRKARFSGRDAVSYHEDNFDDNPVIGWNFYMMPEIAAKGLHLMQGFNTNPKKVNEDLSLPYPDLSKFDLWKPKE